MLRRVFKSVTLAMCSAAVLVALVAPSDFWCELRKRASCWDGVGIAAIGTWGMGCGCNCANCTLCCPSASATIQITVAGFSNSNCSDCSFYNADFFLPFLGDGNPCTWLYQSTRTNTGSTCSACFAGGSEVYSISVSLEHISGRCYPTATLTINESCNFIGPIGSTTVNWSATDFADTDGCTTTSAAWLSTTIPGTHPCNHDGSSAVTLTWAP